MRLQSNAKYFIDNDIIKIVGAFDGKVKYIEPDVRPYMFVRKDDLDKLPELEGLHHVEDWGYRDEYDVPVVTLLFDFPQQVGKARRTLRDMGIPTYEADIPYAERLIYDKVLKVEYDTSNIAFIDIEVSDINGMPEKGNEKVISIAVYDMEGNTYWFYLYDFPTEQAMLRAFQSYLKRNGYTIFAAWNVDFDYNYLLDRFDKLKINSFYLSLMHAVDMLAAFKATNKGLPSYKLEAVAEYLGIAPKVRRTKLIAEMSRGELKHYNMRDAYIIWEIEKQTFIVRKFIAQANTFKVTIDMLNATKLWDALHVREARKYNQVLQSHMGAGEHIKYEGAIVMQPQVGLYENVLDIDVDSLYPHVIWVKGIDIGNFGGKILPALMKRYFELRQKYKKERDKYEEGSPEYIYYDLLQYSYKITINSGYGYFGTPFSRYYDREKALAVTKGGQEVLLKIISFIRDELALDVVYGDTDSVFVKLVDGIDPKAVVNLVNIHIYPYHVKLEAVFKKLIMVKSAGGERASKKRYIGLTSDGKWVVKGIELVRGDVPELTKDIMTKVIEMIFAGASKSEVYAYLHKMETRMRRGEFNDKLVLNVGVKDNIEDYKNFPPHVRAYELAIVKGFKPIDNTIEFVFANGDVVPLTPDVKLDELVFNYNYYWERYIMKPLQRILTAVYAKQSTLADFL